MQKMKLRSKHIEVKYHWFRIKLYGILLVTTGTDNQLADFFTKGLARKEFQAKRLLVCGW